MTASRESTLFLDSVHVSPREFAVTWRVTGAAAQRFNSLPLIVQYPHALELTADDAVSNTLALCAPLAAADSSRLLVSSAVPISDSIRAYWTTMLSKLDLSDVELVFDAPSSGSTLSHAISPPTGRPALLFGGGIESLFALSLLESLDPVLISIVGPGWMNNDVDRYTVKRALEERMQRDTGVTLHRVESNAFAILRDDDAHRNRFATGLLFYWHSVPVCRHFGAQTLVKASELEEALNFGVHDLSLQPRFVAAIAPAPPLMVPFFNCFSKIQMLETLARTRWLEYVYSCFHNTGRRWCGECTKCYRISEYCEHLGIDRRRLDMPAGIGGTAEKGPISSHYWRLADQLYPLPLRRRFGRAFRRLIQQWV